MNTSPEGHQPQTAPQSLAFEASGLPAHVCVLWPDADSARACPRGDMRLAYDPAIGRISNIAFDARCVEYAEGYENSLGFSEFFQGYLDGLAKDLAERHDLSGKRVIEIGSGDGDFISSICRLSGAQGIGYEPSWAAERPDESENGQVKIVRDFFPPRAPRPPQRNSWSAAKCSSTSKTPSPSSKPFAPPPAPAPPWSSKYPTPATPSGASRGPT